MIANPALAVIYCVTPSGHEWAYSTVFSVQALLMSVEGAMSSVPHDRIKIRPVVDGQVQRWWS